MTTRHPLNIEFHPYLTDHRIEGKAVLPCVEAMQILADSARKYMPDINLNVIENASFSKFLYLEPNERADLFNDITVYENGIASKLISISGIGNITRPKEHVMIHFTNNGNPALPTFADVPNPAETWVGIPPDKIYKELVPFGTAYQNILEFYMCEKSAMALVRSGNNENGVRPLGSSFPLDAAFHAACVWGQRFLGFIGFPVGFQKRTIWKATQPGETYFCSIIPVRKISSKQFSVNIRIRDFRDTVYEDVSGVEMKDVTAGRMIPPRWLFEIFPTRINPA